MSICNSKACIHISEPVERGRVPRVTDSSYNIVHNGEGATLFRVVLGTNRVFFYYLFLYFVSAYFCPSDDDETKSS